MRDDVVDTLVCGEVEAPSCLGGGPADRCRPEVGRGPRADRAARIRLLFVMDELNGADGGSEQHLLFLLRRLPRELFRPRLALLGGVRHVDPAALPVRPILLGGCSRARLLRAAQRTAALASLIRRTKADVVHAVYQTSEIHAQLAVQLARRGRVLGVRRNAGYWHTRWTLWLARAARLLPAEYAANCQAARQFATAAEWIAPERVTVLPNPLSLERRDEGLRRPVDRASLGIRDGEQVVGMVASVRPIKDHATLFRAARLVLDRRPRTRFIVLGRLMPEHVPPLKELTRKLGIERQVSWIAPVPNTFSVLPHFDVGVLSSRSEGLSNALIEYAAAGIPAVATNAGGNRDVVEDGLTGFVVPLRSPEALAERVCRLLCDDDLRARLGAIARQRAEARFSEREVLRQYIELYFRLAGKPLPAAHAPEAT